MDVRWYQACRIPPEWARWQLQRDTETVDLAPMLYRLHRAIGGSWTEKLHSSAELQELATAWAAADNPRLCPLCRNGAGTPRHVVMACSAMAPMADELRDALEQYFASLCSTDWWLDQARTTWGLHAPAANAQARDRWPVLSAWGWAVCLEGRERLLGRDDGGHSAAGTLDERPHELAYRALVPKSLGHALCRACAPSLAEPDLAERPVDDGHTSLRQAGEVLSREQDRRRAARRQWEPVIACTTLLALGLRAIRAQYHARIDSWIQAKRWQLLPQAQQQQRPEGPVLGPELGRWALTMNGQATIRELRWQVAPRTVLLARLRQEVPGRLPADPLRLLQPHGLPVLNGEALEWGVGWRTWDGVRMQLTLPPCSCHLGHPRLGFCETCGGCKLPPIALADALPCRWCRSLHGDLCRGCCMTLHHRGGCAWNRGCSLLYRPRPQEPGAFCPDCWWQLVQAASQQIPRPQPTLEGPLAAHLAEVAGQLRPGAGAPLQAPPRGPSRGARRCLLRRLRGQAWADCTALVQEVAAEAG
ncbi:unnamed protein product [Effrenium voratum]|uniref:Uncharacterized protein n=1 Tax=Effrenium voratum TaxID=2562239 RepID=A0AA36MHA1_9DINO|nr:unnamed protein product [Effrenium voratum]